MDAENPRPLLHGQGDDGRRPPGTCVDRLMGQLADKSLSRRTDQKGKSQFREGVKIREKVQIMDQRFPEPDARIKHNPIPFYPMVHRKARPLF